VATLLKTTTLTNIDANSYSDWYKMKVEVYLNSQTNGASSCSSNITIKRYFGTQAAKAGWYSYSSPKITSSISVDGGSYSNSSSTTIKNLEQYNAGNWVQFGSWTGNITHRTDGSQSINVKLAFTAGTSTSYISKDATLTTGSFDLPTIPRNATINSVEIVSVEEGFYITYTKPVETSYVRLIVKHGNTTLKIYNEEELTNTSLEFCEDLETLYQVTSSEAKPTFTFELTTYTDSTLTTQLGDVSTVKASMSILNAKPIFTDFNYKDVDETTVRLTGNDQKLILGYSNVQFEITEENQAIGQKGASVDTYEFVLNEGSAICSADDLPCTFISTNHKHTTLSVYAHDTRGYWTKATKTPNAITNYTRPIINNFEALRIGNVEPNVRLVLNAKLWSGNFGTGDNILTHVAYRVSPVGSTYSEWFDITDTVTQIAGTSGTINVTEENNVFLYSDGVSANFTTGQAYNIQLLVCDGTGAVIFNTTATDTYEITDGMVLDSYYKTSTGYRYAINGIVDPNGDVLQVYDDDGNLIEFGSDDKTIINMVHPVGSVYISTTNSNPTSLFGGKWELIDKEFINLVGEDLGDGTYFTKNTTNVGGYSIYFVRSKNRVSLRFMFKNLVALNDSQLELGTLLFNKLGFSQLYYSLYSHLGGTDGGNAVIQSSLIYDTGVINIQDIVHKTSASSSATVSTNSEMYIEYDLNIPMEYMLDSACDKFYWKKIAD